MIKRDLIKYAAKGFPNPEKMTNNIFLALNTAFINKQSVTIANFGTFKPYKSRAQKLYNFHTKTWSDFDGSYTIKFKPCREVKKRMNRKENT